MQVSDYGPLIGGAWSNIQDPSKVFDKYISATGKVPNDVLASCLSLYYPARYPEMTFLNLLRRNPKRMNAVLAYL